MTLKITEDVTTFGDLARLVDHARAAGAQDHDGVVAMTALRGTRDGRHLRSMTVEVESPRPAETTTHFHVSGGPAQAAGAAEALQRQPMGPTS